MENETHQRKKQFVFGKWYHSPNNLKMSKDGIEVLFEKKFSIVDNKAYNLPKPELMFVSKPWEIEELQVLKEELNQTKSKLNNYEFAEWHKHTTHTNVARDVQWRVKQEINPEFLTQAWCKFHEIISTYPLVPENAIESGVLNSIHLCEAPGAFICCLNHWLKSNTKKMKWKWTATTLNPHYEGNSISKMIIDDRFIIHTLKNWYFGVDNTGNLMDLSNMDALINYSKAKGKIYLVTADGSINCMDDPGEQEGKVVNLHFCEVVAALHLLEKKGSLLLKIFTIYEHQSVCLLYFLSCTFETVQFYKPVTSKGGNSEVYTICLGFKGHDFIAPYMKILRKYYGKDVALAMFNKTDIPTDFIRQIIKCGEFFKMHQCEVIMNNIFLFHYKLDDMEFEQKCISRAVANRFMERFKLLPLESEGLEIVGKSKLSRTKYSNWAVNAPKESYADRQKSVKTNPVNRLLKMMEAMNYRKFTSSTTFKPSKHCPNINIIKGKVFNKVQSSKFCTTKVLEAYGKFMDLLEMEKIVINLPEKDTVQKVMSENEFQHFINFGYDLTCNNNNTIFCIKKILMQLKKEENLILFGYPLLTQFNFGLLYLLMYTFEDLEFYNDDNVGCTILFIRYLKDEHVLKSIEEIFRSANNLLKDQTILSIVPIADLYGSELYPAIVELNAEILKYLVNYIGRIHGWHTHEIKEN